MPPASPPHGLLPLLISVIVLSISVCLSAVAEIRYSANNSARTSKILTPSPYPWPTYVTQAAIPVVTAGPTPTIIPLAPAGPKIVHHAVWLAAPQKISDPGVFAKENFSADWGDPAGVKYYQVGTDSGGRLVMADIPVNSPGGNSLAMLLIQSDGQASLIANYSPDIISKQDKYFRGPTLNAGVKIDRQIDYPDLDYDKTVTVSGFTLSTPMANPVFYNDVGQGDKTLLSQTSWGPLNLMNNGAQIRLDLPDFSYLYYYRSYAFVPDDNVLKITWDTGVPNTGAYDVLTRGGCGGWGYRSREILDSAEVNDLTPVGKTSAGETIYGFKNPDNPTLLKHFGEVYNPSGQDAYTISEYNSDHGLIVYYDRLISRYVVFTNGKYVPAAECAKPVIYLYPQKTIPVSVRLNVSLKKSDPPYQNGWQVIARPNGQLVSDGLTYPYLYWDGTGQIYPEINFGFVVPHSGLENTLRLQLREQGLNQKEITDFMSYWWPLMPKTPYVRLTWLTPNQINLLAPMTVNPRPDTVIRIFLDFIGLNQPVPLIPQTLSAPKRTGFTLVEWGGLRRYP